TGHSEAVTLVAFSPDGLTLVSASGDKTLKLWNVADGAISRTLSGHTDWVSCAAFSKDGKYLVSGGYDNAIKVWNLPQGTLWRTLTGHTGAVEALAFSPDGSVLASASSDKSIKIWAFPSAVSAVRTLSGHTQAVVSVAFSRDGRTLASGGYDNLVKLWRLPGGVEVGSLAGHANAVTSVVFAPDGTKLMSGSADSTVRVWDVSSGQMVKTYDQEVDTGATALGIAFNDTRFAYGREDGTTVVANNEYSRPPTDWPDLLISNAKSASDASWVSLDYMIVTATFPDFFYISADDRSAGIRVSRPGHTAQAGKRFSVTGTVATNDDGERFIESSAIYPFGPASVLPLMMKNYYQGGGSASPIEQLGVKGGKGLNNIGLLVTAVGKVTAIDSLAGTCTIWDGSAFAPEPPTDSAGNKGIQVFAPGLLPPTLQVGDFITATGISSCTRFNDELYPRLLVPSTSTIVIH
ncbi:MAG: WD40 repeat domain-containing protein, partial [Armatimonadota bacterium]